jgi:hypothetical protein
MKKIYLVTVVTVSIFLCLQFAGCENHDINTEDDSSFGLIQKKVFTTSCALSGCHVSEKEYTFPQHKLVLRSGEAYDNLVSVSPQNEHAHHDGLKRVDPGNPENSLLWRKLFCTPGAEYYGNPMPLGSEPISQGKLDYIRKWIEAGAPETGMINADVSLLDDMITVCGEEFIPLPQPAEGKGYQIAINAFDVAPQFEREIFIYKELGNAEPFYVNKMEMRMRRNSHHFLITTFAENIPSDMQPAVDELRDLRNADGTYIGKTVGQMEYQRPVFASQTTELSYQFPAGVALKIPAMHKLDVNLHYVNKSLSPLKGECYLNLYSVAQEEVQHEAKSLFLELNDLYLPSHQKTVIMKTFNFKEDMNIFTLTSHTHKHAEVFQIQIAGGPRDGEIIYTSTNWHHPEIKTFDTPIEIKAAEGLKMIITYNNTTDKNIYFGLTSEDEMAIIYGFYY